MDCNPFKDGDDLEFFPRPYNSAYDIGCYEWHETTNLADKTVRRDMIKFSAFYSVSSGIVLRSDRAGKFSIFDISGRLCANGVLYGEKAIDFASASNGIYLAKFNADGKSEIAKILVIK